jgi:2-(1,2-epoxy-1,2-dihydrophenyl)acetyl-CoA isomerase
VAVTDISRGGLVRGHDEGVVRVLTLNRPERHNALVPELLEAARAEVASAAGSADVRVLLLEAAGPSFSTGGDVAGFARHTGSALRDYARRTVGELHALVMDLMRLEKPVVVAVHGPVTGGSLGLLLAAAVVVASPRAWFAPYYAQVGFSPDGGGTALLPEVVGRRRALAWQLLDDRVDADTALAWGLLTHLDDDPRRRARELATRMAGLRPGALARTKRLVGGDLSSVQERLDRELESFLDQVTTEEAARGMRDFLGSRTRPDERSEP